MTDDDRSRALRALAGWAIDGGRVVREAWIAWASEQPDVADHPSWLVPWDVLPQRDRDVDERIFVAVLAAIEAAGLAVVDRERLARLERLERARDARFRPETTIVEDDDD